MKSGEKQIIFWFRWVGNLGILLSLVAFLLYSSGLIRSRAEPEKVAANWSAKAPNYLEEVGLEFGRGWFFHIGDAYILNVAAIAILVNAALPALLTLSFTWYRKRDFLFGTMAIAVSAILTIAMIGFR